MIPPAPDGVVRLIERKKRGEELSGAEIRALCEGLVAGTVPDYQVAAWLMAVWFRGMTDAETLALTRALVGSGTELDWSDLPRTPVDKHSTGGVGDKTSLVLVPLMAAAGLPFVKMSGRGLGHTGGTLDKLESIPGFSVALPLDRLRAQVREVGCALVGQTAELVPADGLLYALRDVTGTVDSLPLIASSIMSKKLAGGAGAIVLDVKYGAGAFMPDAEAARELARAMVRIGTGAGRRVAAVLSAMDAPLGMAIGNALEVDEAIATLHGRGPADLWELTLELGAQLLMLAGAETDAGSARARLVQLRDSGAGAERFAQLIRAQGGDPEVIRNPARLPAAPVVERVLSSGAGRVLATDARAMADAALGLGAGRRRKGEAVDPAVGVRLLRRVGDAVEAGEPLAEVHARSSGAARDAAARVRAGIRVGAGEPPPSLPHEVITASDA